MDPANGTFGPPDGTRTARPRLVTSQWASRSGVSSSGPNWSAQGRAFESRVFSYGRQAAHPLPEWCTRSPTTRVHDHGWLLFDRPTTVAEIRFDIPLFGVPLVRSLPDKRWLRRPFAVDDG